MKIFNLTGGIASGKSTVCKILKSLGCSIINTDEIAKNTVQKDTPALRKIVEYFGKNILTHDGQLNRKQLGNIIFNNKTHRKNLNEIIHPYIFNLTKKKINHFKKNKPNQTIIIEIPLLIEVSKNKQNQNIILVYTSEKTQLKRLMKRNGFSKKEAIARITSQIPIEEKKKYSSFIINNNDSILKTRERTLSVFQKMKLLNK